MVAVLFEEFIPMVSHVIRDFNGLSMSVCKSRKGYRYIDILDNDGYVVLTPAREVKNNFSSIHKVESVSRTSIGVVAAITEVINSGTYHEQKAMMKR